MTADLADRLKALGPLRNEALFLEVILDFLRPGGRAAVIAPHGLLQNAGRRSRAVIELRERLLAQNQVQDGNVHNSLVIKQAVLSRSCYRFASSYCPNIPQRSSMQLARIVARGSAIVGKASSDEAEQATVDYEGNSNGAVNIKTFADRARHAAGRQSVLYPTIARAVVPRSHLRQVGWFDEISGITLLDDAQAQEALASWLQVIAVDPKELRFSSLEPF